MEEVLPELLRFIGSRPLVGFYLEFDVAMLNKHVRRLLGIELPNEQIEVSGIYYRAQIRRRAAGHAGRFALHQPSWPISACRCSISTTPIPTR